MNKNLSLWLLCSFIISSAYSMQQPPAKSLTLQERKERAWRAYRACERSYHLKCAEYYAKETEIKDEDGKCKMAEHIDCVKVFKETFTEGIYEEVKEFFESKK